MAPAFERDVVDAAAREKEVNLTTYGRKTGKPVRVTIWISTDREHLYVRSGRRMTRDMPQNLAARAQAVLEVGGPKIKVKPQRVTDTPTARHNAELLAKNNGDPGKP